MPSGDSSDLYGALKIYDGKKHILVTGMAGVSKTYTVSQYAEAESRKMFFKALDNGTETIELLGHLIKLTDGNFAWKDGVVTQAFRAAANGEKVLLFIDELLRAPEKELSLLVGCLTPDSRGKLVLRTGKGMEETLKNGVIDEEVIETDLEHLWCVATTNQGRGYHTGKIDLALKDRFRIFEQTMSIDTSKEIATKVLKETPYGSKLSDVAADSIVEKLYKVVEAVETHVEGDGKLKQPITVRHITEVINLSNKPKDLKPRMIDLISNLVMIDSSGRLNVEQKEIIKSYINKFVKV
jgi:MoxR-like ATPase